jgi:hypothetical protein
MSPFAYLSPIEDFLLFFMVVIDVTDPGTGRITALE